MRRLIAHWLVYLSEWAEYLVARYFAGAHLLIGIENRPDRPESLGQLQPDGR